MEDSIFTKMIKGEIPCYKIYEDDKTFAFADIYPIQPGQVLVVPKKQVQFAWDLDDEDYKAVMVTVKKIALRIREIFPEKKYVGMRIDGMQVPHTHVKVYPFDNEQDIQHRPDFTAEPDHEAIAEIANKLAF